MGKKQSFNVQTIFFICFLALMLFLNNSLFCLNLELVLAQPLEESYFQGVHLLESEKKYTEALEIFRKILEINPNYAQAHYQIGEIYRLTDELKKAKVYYQNAINLKPDYLSAHYHLGLIKMELGKYEDALASFKETIRINPDFF